MNRHTVLTTTLLVITLATGYIIGYAAGHKDTIGAMKKLTEDIDTTMESLYKYAYFKGYEHGAQDTNKLQKYNSL